MKPAQANDGEKTPIDSDTMNNGADSGSSGGSSTTSNKPYQPQLQVRTFKKVTIQGNIPIENWTQLYTSFINTLLKNKLNIEVKFIAENTDINPLTDNSQLIKNLRESASQLGLHINTEE